MTNMEDDTGLDALRILLEVVMRGVQPPADESTEEARLRALLQTQVDEIKARGGIVDIPSEIP
jgi:hypothetical protein